MNTRSATVARATPAIRVTGLRKEYPGLTAVDDIDLTVAAGESFAFLGPNGAGKTTTIAMLCTLATPTAGRVEIAGHDTRTSAVAARRCLGLIFQETTLDDDLTAAENLRVHANLYDVPASVVPARIDETLALVALTAHRERLVRTFSGGMRRRLEIARALLHRPKVLILDEPTIGLDPQTRAQIWRYLHHVRVHEGVTLFLTTHYLDEADECDRVAIIDDGRIVAQGSPAELKSVLGTDRIELRTGDDAVAARLLRERFGLTATVGTGGLTVHSRDSTRLLPRLFTELDIPIYEAKVIPPRLDDVFMFHTGHRIGGDTPAEPAPEPAAPPVATAVPRQRTGGARAELRALRTVWQRELLRFSRDGTAAAVSLFQPLIFLFVFGAGFGGLMPSLGNHGYQLFLFSGILVMAVQAPAISVGASILWERQGGFLREMLASPVRRTTLLVGKCLGGASVATCQAALLLAGGGLLGIPYDPGLFALVLAELAVTALAVTALGVLIATYTKRPHTFGTTLTLLTAPLTFLSGSMFPLSAMPTWMAALSLSNPLTYAVDALRRTITAFLPHSPSPLFHPLSWGSWHPPVVVELAIVLVGALVGVVSAAGRFSRPR